MESCILSKPKIMERLRKGEIFKSGTWDEENVRSVAYDLRIAEDFCIIPEADYPNGRKYPKGEKRKKHIVIKPGEVAFVSTEEKVCMPWDLSANIGIKFTYARQGILVLTGLLVDPGYGLKLENNGKWTPKEDERIHFLLANVGSNDVVMTPKENKICSIQFFSVEETLDKKEIPSGEDMQNEFFANNNSKESGLVFFKHMAETMRCVKQSNDKVDALEKATHQLLYFGVFLVSGSVFAAAFAYIISILNSVTVFDRLKYIISRLPDKWPQVLLLISLFIFSFFIFNAIIKILGNLVCKFALRKRCDKF